MALRLKPANKHMETIEVDHIGWSYLEKLLNKLGQSTQNITFTVGNSTDIKAGTAHRWGNAILTALDDDEICDIKIEDPTSKRNFKLVPMIKSTASSYFEYEDLSYGDKEWLKAMANFFVDSMGVCQE